MSDNTLIQQGYFTGTGADKIIPLRSDVDWMEVYCTAFGANNTYFLWQRGMAAGYAIARTTAGVASVVTSGCFTLIDTSAFNLATAVATTAIPDTTNPVVATGDTTGLTANSTIVRIYHTSWPHLSGLDVLCGTVVNNTSFAFAATLATASGVVGGAGTYRILGTPPLYVPTRRVIANITAAANAVVTTLAPHGLVAGQAIRLVVPGVCSMTQAHGLTANVVSVTNVYTIVIDLDTTAFTAFTFPTAAQAPCTYAEIVPFGETASGSYVNLLDDAVYNQSYLAMKLGGGAGFPGAAASTVYWRAGKSFSNN